MQITSAGSNSHSVSYVHSKHNTTHLNYNLIRVVGFISDDSEFTALSGIYFKLVKMTYCELLSVYASTTQHKGLLNSRELNSVQRTSLNIY